MRYKLYGYRRLGTKTTITLFHTTVKTTRLNSVTSPRQYQYQAQTIYVHSVGFVGKYEFYTNHLSIYEKFIFSPRTAMQYLSCT